MRAVVVLPTPRTPVRIQACGMRPDSNALEMVRTMASWPIRSAKVDGRYLRASTRYGADGVAASFIESGMTSFCGPPPRPSPFQGEGASAWRSLSSLANGREQVVGDLFPPPERGRNKVGVRRNDGASGDKKSRRVGG